MRSPFFNSSSPIERRELPSLPPGTGFLLAGGISLLVWGMIAGIAAIL